MKTQITKLMAAAMLVIAPLAANATTEKSVKISKKNQKTVVLHLGDLTEGTRVSILDEKGEMLFEDTAEESNYSKTFDLTLVSEGEVYLQVESADKLEILPIEITATSAAIKRLEETVIEKPIVKMNGNQAKVFFGNNNSDMKVTFFDNYGDIAHRETVADGTGSKTYDLSKLADGNYKLHIRTNGRSFYHTIILD